MVKEDIIGELIIVLETSKCTLDMKTCEKCGTGNMKDVCTIISMKKFSLITKFLDTLTPSIMGCPVKAGNYTTLRSVFDLSPFALIPMDGYIWVVNAKLVSSENGGTRKKILLCVNIEVKIMKTRKQETT
jgi:hypothetical protein